MDLAIHFIYSKCISFKGLPQSIHIAFNEPMALSIDSRLEIKFQGGFVGSVFHLSFDDSSGTNIYKKSFYPDDVNDLQVLQLEPANVIQNIKKMTILFEKSSDFFGRIIIYDLRLISWIKSRNNSPIIYTSFKNFNK